MLPERTEREQNHRDSQPVKIQTENRKRGRQEERGEWLRQPIFFKQLCFHSTGHQGHYPGVNPQSDGAGSLLGQARVAAHQQGRHGWKERTYSHTWHTCSCTRTGTRAAITKNKKTNKQQKTKNTIISCESLILCPLFCVENNPPLMFVSHFISASNFVISH